MTTGRLKPGTENERGIGNTRVEPELIGKSDICDDDPLGEEEERRGLSLPIESKLVATLTVIGTGLKLCNRIGDLTAC